MVGSLDRSFPWIPLSVVVAVSLLAALGLIDTSQMAENLRIGTETNSGGVILVDLREQENAEGIRGELILKDPTPLFLPTRWNSGQVEPQGLAPATSFGAIDAKLVFSAVADDLRLPDGVAVPESPMGALERIESLGSTVKLHERDESGEALPRRLGYMEVAGVESGKILHHSILVGNEGEPALSVPVETILSINAVGIWVRPTVIQAPDGASVDFDQINLLLQGLHLEAILEPGIYRIILGP